MKNHRYIILKSTFAYHFTFCQSNQGYEVDSAKAEIPMSLGMAAQAATWTSTSTLESVPKRPNHKRNGGLPRASCLQELTRTQLWNLFLVPGLSPGIREQKHQQACTKCISLTAAKLALLLRLWATPSSHPPPLSSSALLMNLNVQKSELFILL